MFFDRMNGTLSNISHETGRIADSLESMESTDCLKCQDVAQHKRHQMWLKTALFSSEVIECNRRNETEMRLASLVKSKGSIGLRSDLYGHRQIRDARVVEVMQDEFGNFINGLSENKVFVVVTLTHDEETVNKAKRVQAGEWPLKDEV